MIQIRPVSDLRNKFPEIETLVNNGNPVYLTKNGYGAMVVLSLEEYATVNAEHIANRGININAVSSGIVFCKYCSHRILSPYRSINYLLQKSEAFQSVHHVTFILCYTILYNFFALAFSLIRVRKHWWDDITQGKQ